MSDSLTELLDIARLAGKLIAGVYADGFEVEYKADNDPVTRADMSANALIVGELSRRFPGAPIVAEESDASTFGDYQNAECVFFVDPLDGTREFIARNGEFVVMLGMVEGKRATAGVVLSPVSGEAWCGAAGRGAFHVLRDGTRTPIAPSRVTQLGDASLLASRSRNFASSARTKGVLGVREVRALGSAGLKGAHVADGRADLYLSPGVAGYRWDACAVDALVTAAGGKFSDAHGEPFDYRASNLRNQRGLLASNPALHAPALQKLELERTRRPVSR